MDIGSIYVSSQLRANQQAGICVVEIQLNHENSQNTRIRFQRLHPYYHGEIITLTITALEASSWIPYNGVSLLMQT